jgi:putative transposase
MSALPQTSLSQKAAAAADSSPWLSLEEAARRSNRSEGHLARLCRKQWEAAGLAEQRKAGPGKATWFIRQSAHPDFSPVRTSEQVGEQLDEDKLSDEQRELLRQRVRIVTGWIELLLATPRGETEAAMNRYLDHVAQAEGMVISPRTLDYWRGRWDAQKKAGLIDGRWKIKGAQDDEQRDPYADFYAELETWYLDQNERKVRACYKLAVAHAHRRHWSIPSYRQACRHIEKIDKARRTLGRKGNEAFANKIASFIQRDYTRIVDHGVERQLESNDIWCADDHLCDCLVSYQGRLIRPWLSAIEDIRSRKIVGWHFTPGSPDATSIFLAIRNAILATDLCTPKFFYCDNGKTFDCYMLQGATKKERQAWRWEKKKVRVEHDRRHFKGILGAMECEVWHAIAFNAKAKPVERFFGTYEDQFGKLEQTYCGRNPQEKPEHLEERLEKGLAPTFEQYVQRAATWIAQVYHTQIHSGHGMDAPPNEVYVANLLHKKTTTRTMLDHLLMKTGRPVSVGRNGVVFQNVRYGQFNPVLAGLVGQEVRVCVDPANVARALITDIEGRPLCDVTANELVPFGKVGNEEMKRAISASSRHNSMMKKAARAGRAMRMHVDPLELLVEGRQSSSVPSAPGDPAPPPIPSIKPIRTGLEEHSEEIAEAHQRLKIAAGAESMSPQRGMSLSDFTDQMTSETDSKSSRSDEPASATFLRLMEEDE